MKILVIPTLQVLVIEKFQNYFFHLLGCQERTFNQLPKEEQLTRRTDFFQVIILEQKFFAFWLYQASFSILIQLIKIKANYKLLKIK